MTLETTRDPNEWEAWRGAMGLEDAYYRADYGRIWEGEESAEWVGLRYGAGEAGEVLYPVLRDPLDYLPAAEGHCDLRTAYDFGGPVVRGERPAEAMREFREALEGLAGEWGVVTEFARLHPYRVTTLPDAAGFHADNLHVDLTRDVDGVRGAYADRHARRVGEAEEAGLEVALYHGEEAGAWSEDFIELYYRTMLRVGAGGHYFFLPETLRSLVRHPKMTLAVVRLPGGASGGGAKIVGAGMFFRAAEVVYYYLSGSHPHHLEKRPNNLMLDRIVEYGCGNSFERLHLGGGDESLRGFKSQVATGSVSYHILQKVYDEKAYRRLAKSVGGDPDPDADGAFPAYWPTKYTERERPPLF